MTAPNTLRALPLAILAALAACDDKAQLDQRQQIGATPVLPTAHDFLVPPMQVPTGVGWKGGTHPTVASGLKIELMAGGLVHPRQLLSLPNGDVLVVESNSPGSERMTTPKQLVAGIVKNRSGKGVKGGNQISLLRREPGATTWTRHVFLEHLNSPFGVQLIGDTLYVANTDAIVKFPYVTGETQITAPGVQLADLPGTVNHHWTKSLLASPDGKKLYAGIGSKFIL